MPRGANQHTKRDPIPDGYKYCSTMYECAHPDGPILPATREYFAPNKKSEGGLAPRCKICAALATAKSRHGDNFEQWFTDRQFAHQMEAQGLKRCRKCQEWFPATTEHFASYVRGKGSLRSWCRTCNDAYNQKYRDTHLTESEIAHRELMAHDAQLAEQGLKRCRKCDRALSAHSDYFFLDRTRPDGFRDMCKECDRLNQLKYIEENRKKIAAARKLYVARNPDYQKLWRRRNPDKAAARERRYRQKYPEKVVTKAARRRSRILDLPNDFTTADYEYALTYFNGCCAVCGRQLNDLFGERKGVMDHWQPVSKGGPTTPQNLVPLCHGVNGCNNIKSNRDPIEWLVDQFGKRKASEINQRIQAFFKTVRKTELH